jgi:hypothetical protein
MLGGFLALYVGQELFKLGQNLLIVFNGFS